ncbi:MAG: hypothetical protein HY901_05325 [Deltaproteobacteria bacterium]|nr:hypothetical protein [Deltaproteobacteria bacterium]
MADSESYVRHAFFNKLNLTALGGAVVASLALMNPLPALVAVGAELVYLGVVPSLPRFKRGVRARRELARHGTEQQATAAMLEALSPNQRESFNALRDRILENYQRVPGGSVLAETSSVRMDGLLHSFVRLLSTLNSYRRYLTNTDRQAIERELAELKADLESASAASSEKVREVKKRRVEILGKRLERFDRAAESRELISHQLASIDDFLRLLHEQSITLRDPDVLGQQLDHLAIEIQATDETVHEMERFSAITEELGPSAPLPERVR